jgi:hypothetical protein
MANLDPKVYIYGPLKSTDTSWGEGFPVYAGQESRSEGSAELNVQPIPFFGSDEAFLTGFFAGEDISFTGIATSNRVLQDRQGKEYNVNGSPTINTKQDALADYIIELESLCVPNPGIGYVLTDSMRGRTEYDAINPLTEDVAFDEDEDVLGSGFIVESVDWEYEEAAPRQISYTIEGFKSEGVTEDPSNRDAYIQYEWANVGRSDFFPIDEIKLSYKNDPEQKNLTKYNRFILGNVISKRVERSIGMERYNIAYGGSGNTLSIPTEGIQAKIAVEGAVTANDFFDNQSDLFKDVSDSELEGNQSNEPLKEFSTDVVNYWLGNNLDMIYGESMTDRRFYGQLSNFSTTFEAGSPSRMLYSLEFVVGATDGQS